MKKFLSILCALALMVTAVLPASAATVNVAVPESGEKATFTSDFVTKFALDDTSELVTNTGGYFYDNNSAAGYADSKITAIEWNTDTAYTYNESTASAKISYDFSGKYEAMVRFRKDISTGSGTKDYSFAFWIYSTQEIKMKLRTVDSGSTNEQIVETEAFIVPAGESIVEIPWTAFSVTRDGYVPSYKYFSTPSFYILRDTEMQNAGMEATGTVYIDNIGYYPCTNEVETATRGNFALKEDFSSYESAITEKPYSVPDYSAKYGAWSYGQGGWSNTLMTEENGNKYLSTLMGSNHSSNGWIQYSMFIYNNAYKEATKGDYFTDDACLTFKINPSQAIKLSVAAYVNKSSGERNTSDIYYLPQGEQIVSIPLSSLKLNGEAVTNIKYLYSIRFYYYTTNTLVSGATVTLDDIGITPEATVHGDDFISKANISSADSKLLVNYSSSATTAFVGLSLSDSAHAYYGDNDGTAIKADYDFTDTAKTPRFYVNKEIKNTNADGAALGSGSEFAFWVATETPITIALEASTYNNSWGSQQVTSSKHTLSAGEHIVRIPWTELKYANLREATVVDFTELNQPRIALYKAEGGTDTGSIYVDQFGWYPENSAKVGNEISELINSLNLFNDLEIAWVDSIAANLSTDKYVGIAQNAAASLVPAQSGIEHSTTVYAPNTFEVTVKMPTATERYKLAEYGVYFIRKALLGENELVQKTEGKKDAKYTVKDGDTLPDYYTAVLIDSQGTSKAVTKGYYNTEYAARPYVIYYDLGNNNTQRIIYGDLITKRASDAGDTTALFDGNTETAWSVGAGVTTVEKEFDTEVTANAVVFDADAEAAKWIDEYSIEAVIDGAWQTIYRSDEMTSKTGILDSTITAKRFRFTFEASQSAEIKGISFITAEAVQAAGFENASYYRAEKAANLTDNQKAIITNDLTDIIMFNYGYWTAGGDFEFKNNYTEETLETGVNEVKALNPNINVWLSFGNFDSSVTDKDTLLATPEARARLIEYAVDYCVDYQLTGVEFDYEFPENTTQWDNFSTFLVELKTELSKYGYKLSVALAGNCGLSKEAIAAIDRLELMTYSIKATDIKSDRHSTYYGTLTQLQSYLDKGFNKSQIVLGLPFYGCYDAPNGEIPSTARLNNMPYTSYINAYGDEIKSYTNNIDGYYFNGSDMIRDKAYYALTEGLAGVYSWSVDCDVDTTDARSLNGAINDVLDRFVAAE